MGDDFWLPVESVIPFLKETSIDKSSFSLIIYTKCRFPRT